MMTSDQYEESLRKLNLKAYMFGKRVENVVDDPIIRLYTENPLKIKF